ncbi:hypothetical protein [Xylocopilactobacillus apis]|uniref:Uncharacterized protein n=1 Tax=Xylocopilactobacillus apis TaxID=2932183 RepID=A0AAU9D3U7_9LACO|nr:hypothetical protein [Xylocopilactobacillus apis]BDR55532.1 hypothetical protein KIMC2_00940 [Xylocopilactobacillus apis]
MAKQNITPWDEAARQGLKELQDLENKEQAHDELPNVHDLKLPMLPLSEQLTIAQKIRKHYEDQNYRTLIKIYTPQARFIYLDLFGGQELDHPVYSDTGEFVLPASDGQQILAIQNLIYYHKLDPEKETKIAFQLTWDHDLAKNNPQKLHQNFYEK